VRALKGGAVDFVEKPFNPQALLDLVQQAIVRDAEIRAQAAHEARLAERMALLTPREQEVMGLVVAGKANKVIAIDLSISERTVELHRARIMKKMQARSLAELMRMVLPPSHDMG
jgi:FixJ family two-component response regulator